MVKLSELPQVPQDLLVLLEDVGDAEHDLKAEDSAFRRRSYVRTALSAVEGIVHELKSRAAESAARQPDTFSIGELSFLRDEGYTLDDHGHVRSQPRFIPIAANVLFTFKAYMRSKGGQAVLNLDHPGWAQFRRAIAIRNRITHPKKPSDLVLADDDLKTVREGFHWFVALLARNLLNILDELQAASALARQTHDDT